MNAPNLNVVQNVQSLPQPINDACRAWLESKRIEETAREARVMAEERIIKLLEFTKLEGSSTINTDDKLFKISLTAKLDRKLDGDAYLMIQDKLPENMRPVKTKIELDTKGIKWMEKNAKKFYALVAPCITTKPAKTAVKIEYMGGA